MTFVDDNSIYPLSPKNNIVDDLVFWTNQFLEAKETERISKKTIKSYREALDAFIHFAQKYEKSNNMKNIGAKYINRFLIEYQCLLANKKIENNKATYGNYAKIIEQKEKMNLGKNDASFHIEQEFKNTLLHRQIAVKMLLKFISKNNQEGHDYQAMFHNITKIKLTSNKTEYLTVDELDEIIDLMTNWDKIYKQYKPKQSKRYAYRDALLILLYALTGARSEEVVKIRLQDVDEFTAKKRNFYKIRIVEAKGGKPRDVAVEKDFIEKYINYFKSELPDNSYYLSSTYKNKCYQKKPHHQDNIRKFGNFVVEQVLGLKNKTGLHLFRRGYATKRILNDKASLAVISSELGNTVGVLERFYFKYDVKIAIENDSLYAISNKV